MIHFQTIKQILEEQRTFDYQKVIIDAIKNRRKISFYYNGPSRPRKDSVKPGRRILVEPTAIGLTKKGNLAFKGFVKPPSVTKTGFEKHNWRTFLLNRLHRLELTNDTFNQPQSGYNDGDDSSFSRVDFKVDFGKKSRINKFDQPVYNRLGRKPNKKILPPDIDSIDPNVNDTEPETNTPNEPDLIPQIEPINPRIEPELDPEQNNEPETDELPQPKVKEKPPIIPDNEVHTDDDNDDEEEEENQFLQEQIKQIKSLMLKIKKL